MSLRHFARTACAVLLVSLGPLLAGCGQGGDADGKAGEAEGMDESHTWDLSEIYPDREAWQADRRAVLDELESVAADCKGNLGESAPTLAECMRRIHEIRKTVYRLHAYASMRSDQDTRVQENLAMDQQASVILNRMKETLSFVEPEILAVGRERIERFIEIEPDLAPYTHPLRDILRRAPHTLTPEAERVMALSGMVTGAPAEIYRILANADIDWPTVTLSDGSELRLDQTGYTRGRRRQDRDDRRKVFDAFWGKWQEYERTMGVALYSQLKRDVFRARARKYDSALAASLDENRIPPEVYHTLIEQTHEHLDTLHRYFRMRERLLGVEQLHYYDIYPPMTRLDREYPIERAKQLVIEATKPLGEDYTAVLERGFANRWMDVYPRQGKRSGAYMNGSAYDVHPYVLMNYTGDYGSVSTLAHEWGHAVHSHLANRNQPFATADYPIFLAEIASTFNEQLLLEQMLEQADSDEERLFYLGRALEGLRGTFFRQAMFAEFELKVHEKVEQDESLTGADFTRIYGKLLRRYHGSDEGVVAIDDRYAIEWAYIPHFYYNFYVYQYATSIAAGSLLAQRVLDGEKGARQQYLDLLRAGGSDYPHALLKEAGVDLTRPEPYRALIDRMNDIMDRMENILAGQ